MDNPLPEDFYKRRRKERKEDIRGAFFRDQTAIIHSMPFRRLKHKTQVFFAPENDHVCTRIEHVLHVATIATTICKGLNKNGNWKLNEELAFAIGIGHDLGHAPFGHAGETAINEILKSEFQFQHEINSYRVAAHLANNGEGLNLTYGVLDGIICHNGENFERELKPNDKPNELEKIKNRKGIIPTSYEGCIVRFSDKIAYLGRDIEDALIANFIKEKDVPESIKKELGNSNGEIINTLVLDIIHSSKNNDCICFSEKKFELINELKKFNYKHIYNNKRILEYKEFGKRIIKNLFEHLSNLYAKYGLDTKKYLRSNIRLDKLFGRYLEKMRDFYTKEGLIPNQIIIDYIAGMTDDFALESIKQITIPKPIEFK